MIKRGRRIIPNAMLYAHRETEKDVPVCLHKSSSSAKKGTGLIRQWHKNGRLALEYSSVNGKPNGLFRDWWPDGKLDFEKVYDMGEPRLIRQFNRLNGQLILEIISDGCAVYQRFWNSDKKDWDEYFVVHNKDVSRKEYVSFLKNGKRAK